MNTVAVILTVYKNDKFYDFKEALNSLYNQTIGKCDIYVQEDGFVTEEIHAFLLNEIDSNRIFYLGI